MRTPFFLLFLTSICATSQNLESLKSNARKLYDANYNMDFDAVAAVTYPKVYEGIGLVAFTEKLDADYENPVFRKRLQIVEPVFQYSEMKIENNTKFYVITYKNPVRYFFENKLDAATAKQKADSLKTSAMAYDVIIEPQRNTINVKRYSKLVAVSDKNTNGEWRFFNFDDAIQKQSFNALFGDGVKKALGL